MSPGEWFLFWMLFWSMAGYTFGRSFGSIVAGICIGFFCWCMGGIFWIVDSAYDCSGARDEYGYYSSEAREACK